jgi:elongation factor P
MINVNDFKVGQTISYEDSIYQVLEFQHVKPGKGAAIVKAKLKNLRTGSIAEYSFGAGTKVPKAHISKQTMQFMYKTGTTYSFMNMETYEQVDLDESQITNEAKYLKEGLEIFIIFYESEMLGVELPEKIDFKITKTEPAIKGNTATNAVKDAIIETGMLVRVPLFIEEGEEIIISTKDGKYVSRK